MGYQVTNPPNGSSNVTVGEGQTVSQINFANQFSAMVLKGGRPIVLPSISQKK